MSILTTLAVRALTFFGAAIISFGAHAQNTSPKALNTHEFLLANGMRVIVREDHRAPTVAHMVWYRAGSIDEVNGKTGVAHVLEHMTPNEARDLVGKYLFYLRKNGRIVLICPQSRGFQSDSTHVHYFSAESLTELACDLGLRVESTRSFPFPRFLGRVFTHNETIVLARL